MSGSAGGNRIPREAVQSTVDNYIDKVLSKFPGFKQAKVTGSYNTGTKKDFGDIDLVVQLEGIDKKLIKQELAKFFSSLPDSIIVPFKSEKYSGKKFMNTGELVTILYPISGYPGQFVQIDNIVSISEEESTFKNTFLDYPAEIQGLLLGLAKVICLEEDPKEIFKRLGITDIPELGPNQEYEFNLSSSGLTLRIVTLDNFKETDRTEAWKTSDWNKIKLLFENYNIDSDFSTLLSDLSKKLTNSRSKNRVKGIFKSMVSIKSGEVGTPKGDNKQKALDSVDSLLENKPFKPIIKSLIKDLLPENFKLPKKIIALYGGKFKPPHKGHLEAVKSLINKADEIVIIISPKEHEGITAQQSLNIWNNLFIPKLGLEKVRAVIASSPSPITQTLDTIEADQDTSYLAVYGKGEESKYKNVGIDPRYKNGKAEDVGAFQNDNVDISATGLRAALFNNKDITPWMPDGITSNEYKQALGLDIIDERVYRDELPRIDRYADRALAPKIDIEISRHFGDQVNLDRNRPEIEPEELYNFFTKLSFKKDQLANLLDKDEVVTTDSTSNINIPFVKVGSLKDKIVAKAKTIMRKRNYQTSNPKLVFEKTQGDSIICDNCNWTWKIEDGGNDLYICHKCGHDNTPQQSSSNNFFEPLQNQDLTLNTSSDSSRVDYYKDHIKNVVPSDFKVDKHKDKIVVSNITKKGLEHNKEFKNKLISLTMFMMDNGLNIEPLPNVNFIEDDKENANNMLGRTAHYDPNEQCVTLYTYGRHPKDILRSYAHEMIHHKQNLEDRLQNYNGQDINEDDHLKQLEIEAYRDGNIYFRSWENSKN
jgi:cytidyltransferase-like protein